MIGLDPYTASFSPSFYLDYLCHFPEQAYVQESWPGEVSGYMIGKDEGYDGRGEYHVHVSAVTVAYPYRRAQLARRLMKQLENLGDAFSCRFCDLFVRSSNESARHFYSKLKYATYRTILRYYADENGYDLRKALARDPERECETCDPKRAILTRWVDYPL